MFSVFKTMPLTADLYPGKYTTVQGEPHLEAMVAPTYNGTLNKYAGNNLNSSYRNKVFAIGPDGKPVSQNQALINEDIYSPTQKNKDLEFSLPRFKQHTTTYEERYDLIGERFKVNLPKPHRTDYKPS